MSRSSTEAGWPVGRRLSLACRQAVKVGSINAQRASDMSLGYGFCSFMAEFSPVLCDRRRLSTIMEFLFHL